MWTPLAELRKEEGVLRRGNHPGFSVLGRLKPGVSLKQANADLDTIAVELERQYPDTNATRRVRMDLLLDSAVSEYRASLRLLLGAVACVLLIACANVANLQLARALSRGKELAVRAALGASQWQLMRQMLIESILLGIFGAIAGMMLASLESRRHSRFESRTRSAVPGNADRSSGTLLYRRGGPRLRNPGRSLAGLAGLEKCRDLDGAP